MHFLRLFFLRSGSAVEKTNRGNTYSCRIKAVCSCVTNPIFAVRSHETYQKWIIYNFFENIWDLAAGFTDRKRLCVLRHSQVAISHTIFESLTLFGSKTIGDASLLLLLSLSRQSCLLVSRKKFVECFRFRVDWERQRQWRETEILGRKCGGVEHYNRSFDLNTFGRVVSWSLCCEVSRFTFGRETFLKYFRCQSCFRLVGSR